MKTYKHERDEAVKQMGDMHRIVTEQNDLLAKHAVLPTGARRWAVNERVVCPSGTGCVSDLGGNGGYYVLVLLDAPDKRGNFLVYHVHNTLSEYIK